LDGTLLDASTSTTGSIFQRVAWTADDQYILTSGLGYHEPNADGHIVFTPRSCQNCTPYWGYTWSPRNQMWAIGNESGNVSVYRADGSWIDDLQNEGNVDTIEWSPDGKLLAGGNTIWAWDGLEFHPQADIGNGRIASLTWSPDGGQLASVVSNFSDIRLWDTEGNPLDILQGHSGSVEILSWSPDGTQLASGGADYTVRLWDMASLQPQD
jgi:WD40 repeat protein